MSTPDNSTCWAPADSAPKICCRPVAHGIYCGTGRILCKDPALPTYTNKPQLCAAGLQLTAYCGPDRILCEATDQHSNRLIFYREPTPEGVGECLPWFHLLHHLRSYLAFQLLFVLSHTGSPHPRGLVSPWPAAYLMFWFSARAAAFIRLFLLS